MASVRWRENPSSRANTKATPPSWLASSESRLHNSKFINKTKRNLTKKLNKQNDQNIQNIHTKTYKPHKTTNQNTHTKEIYQTHKTNKRQNAEKNSDIESKQKRTLAKQNYKNENRNETTENLKHSLHLSCLGRVVTVHLIFLLFFSASFTVKIRVDNEMMMEETKKTRKTISQSLSSGESFS